MDKIDTLIFKVVSVIAEHYETTTDEILGDKYCPVRSFAMTLSVDLVEQIHPKGASKRVANLFGRNHATVSLNRKAFLNRISKNEYLAFKYTVLKKKALIQSKKTVISGLKAEKKLAEISKIKDSNILAESLRIFLNTYNLKPLLWN